MFLSGPLKLCVSIVFININLLISVIIHKLFCKLLRVISSLQYSILIGYWNFFSWWTKFLIVLIFITFNDWVFVVFGPFPAWRIETKNRDPLGVNSPKTNMIDSESDACENYYIRIELLYRVINLLYNGNEHQISKYIRKR